MSGSVDASELNRLVVDLGDVSDKAIPFARAAVHKTGTDIVTDAKAIIVIKDIIDTGNLLNSVSQTIDGDGLGAEIGPTASYGIYQEHGTSTQPGRPYLGPAFDRRAPGLESALGQIADGLLG